MTELAALKESVSPIIAELRGLVGAESKHHAEIVGNLEVAILARAIPDVRTQFCSLDMWGGSGSVADLLLRKPGAQKRSCELLSRLNSEFRNAGIECPRANQWTTVFDEWLEQGVLDKNQ